VFLVYDGTYHEQTFISMTQEGSFPRLVQLIRDGTDDELGLHRVLVELMYEMSRIQELAYDELGTKWRAVSTLRYRPLIYYSHD